MPQGVAWFPLVAVMITLVLLLTVRRKPASKNDNNDKTDK